MAHHSNQILRTLNDQIQNLTPLRESFKRLQIYYSKITADFDELIKYGKQSEAEMMSQMRYLEEIHRELEYQFSVCGEQLRETQSQQASLLLQRNQQVVQSQALKSRLQLQASQKAAFQAKRKDLLEYSSKIQFNISKYKQLIHNLQLVIKSKQYENLDTEREIKKLQLINSKISHLNKESEESITMTQQKNERIVEQLHQLEEKLDTYQRLIEAKEKLNKQNVQILISKTEELQQIRNRKQYTQKLIESQVHSQKELLRSYGQVDSVLNIKRQKLHHLQQQNHQYEAAIEEQACSRRRNKEELDRLTNYLQSLTQANEILFKQLQRSCTLDREVQVLLSEKLQKLYKVNEKITEHEILTKFDVNMLHQKTLSKNANTSSSSLLKQELLSRPKQSGVLTPSAKKSLEIDIEQRLSRVRDQQMSSTWGSFTKENYRHDL